MKTEINPQKSIRANAFNMWMSSLMPMVTLVKTQGTCSQLIDVTADEHDVIQQVFFLGGCNGNLQGIGQLVRGQKIEDVIQRLDGIRCGSKRTSCPDQLCRALELLKQAPLKED